MFGTSFFLSSYLTVQPIIISVIYEREMLDNIYRNIPQCSLACRMATCPFLIYVYMNVCIYVLLTFCTPLPALSQRRSANIENLWQSVYCLLSQLYFLHMLPIIQNKEFWNTLSHEVVCKFCQQQLQLKLGSGLNVFLTLYDTFVDQSYQRFTEACLSTFSWKSPCDLAGRFLGFPTYKGKISNLFV